MKREIARKWRKALLSGEYQQTKGSLRNKEGYCCLGVLCDLYQKSEHKGRWLVDKVNPEKYSFLDGIGMPPNCVHDWAGIQTRFFDLPIGKCLDEINDEGASFKEIAKLIKDNEKEL